jgi:hypothetical protein
MDFSSSHDHHIPDSAYSPLIVNEQDQQMGAAEEAQNGHSNGQPQSTMTSPLEGDAGSRYHSPSLAYQPQPSSRPGSGMGQPQQDPNRQQQPASKSSVVIKVGMVGDAQIGKTSLMVKYVEGSWDEDYIQTLGKRGRARLWISDLTVGQA